MSTFSNYLEEFLTKKNISIKQFAKECEFPISKAKAIVHGTTLPDSLEIVQHIYNVLHFSLYERQQLTEYYIEATEGTDLMKSFQIMEQIVKKISFSHKKRNFFLPELNYKDVPEISQEFVKLNSKKEAHEAIKYALEYALSKGLTDIYAYMQPEAFFYNMLLRYFNHSEQAENITLHQIFCLNTTSGDEDIQNLQSINEIVSIFLSDLKTDISFYHDNIKHHINDMNVLPFMINIGDMTIYLNMDSNLGYFVKNAEYGQYMRALFLTIKKKTKSFTTNAGNELFYQKVSNKSCNIFSIADFKMVSAYKNKIFPVLSGHFIIPEQKLEKFLNDGIITDLGKGQKIEIEENKRYNLLKEILATVKSGNLNLYFSKEAYPLSEGSGIIIIESKFFIIKYNCKQPKIWYLEDSVISRLFKQYFHYRVDTKRTYSKEESTGILEELLRKHNNR